MSVLTFDIFCHKACDGLYDPNFSQEEQCTGYKKLKNMVINGIVPATKEETIEWENSKSEMWKPVPDKYLRFLHANLRPIIIENWDLIGKLGDPVEEFVTVK
jgi:hypothetical protein